jgi:transcriptional regulator with XRE-family HTH domain
VIRKLQDVEIQSNLDRLVLLIRHLGIKQYEFARELGYTPVYVQAVINGRVPITLSFLERVDQFLEKRHKERALYAKELSILSSSNTDL